MILKKVILFLVLIVTCSTGWTQQKDTILMPTEIVDYNAPKRYLLKKVDVKGVETINTTLLLNSIGLIIGDSITIPGEYITAALKRLWSHKYYSDIKTYIIEDGEDMTLELHLKERPLISTWSIVGPSASQKKDLFESLKLSSNTQYSEYTIQSSVKAIQNYYKKKGFYNANVDVIITNDTLKFAGRNYVKVAFGVNKGPKVKIKEIVFEGNDENMPDKKLKAELKHTKEKKILNFFKGSKFKEADYEQDKLNLIDYMHSRGYRNADVLSDSIYKINDKRIGIKIKLQQGEKYFYRNITWTGNEKYDNNFLEQVLGLKKGDVYDSRTMNNRLGLSSEAIMKGMLNVNSLYQDDGHLAFKLEPVETELPGDSIDVDIRISEGKQFRINDVIITGNTRTNDRVVRRELFMRPGELYSQQLLINSMSQLGSMGNFEATSTQPEILEESSSDDLINIRYNLEEASTDNFSLSGGFGAGTFVISVGVSFNNVSLRKIFKKNAWRPYPAGDNQRLRLQVQSNGTYYKAISFSFLEPWLGGKKPNSLGVSFYYSQETNGRTVFDKGDAQFGTLGASVEFGKRLRWPDPFFNVNFGVNYQHYNLNNWSNFIFRNGISHILSFSATLSRNTVNSPLYPTAGSEFMLKATATFPYSLLKDKDYYKNPKITDQERYKFVEFFKFDFKARWFQSLFRSQKFVLYAGASFGYLGHYNPDLVSPFEGFSVGGAGLTGYNIYGITYVSLRGYKDGSLTPGADYGEQARIYSKYTVELRYPFVSTASTTMYGLVFAEAGNAGNGWRTFNPFELKKSLGVGVRIFLPIVGMFGVDAGYGFDRVPGGTKPSGFQFHFSMGQQF